MRRLFENPLRVFPLDARRPAFGRVTRRLLDFFQLLDFRQLRQQRANISAALVRLVVVGDEFLPLLGELLFLVDELLKSRDDLPLLGKFPAAAARAVLQLFELVLSRAQLVRIALAENSIVEGFPEPRSEVRHPAPEDLPRAAGAGRTIFDILKIFSQHSKHSALRSTELIGALKILDQLHIAGAEKAKTRIKLFGALCWVGENPGELLRRRGGILACRAHILARDAHEVADLLLPYAAGAGIGCRSLQALHIGEARAALLQHGVQRHARAAADAVQRSRRRLARAVVASPCRCAGDDERRHARDGRADAADRRRRALDGVADAAVNLDELRTLLAEHGERAHAAIERLADVEIL